MELMKKLQSTEVLVLPKNQYKILIIQLSWKSDTEP